MTATTKDEDENSEENRITIYSIFDDGKTVLSETTTDVFMRQARVRRVGDRYLLQIGPVEVDMPAPAIEELVWDLLQIQSDEALKKLMKEIEERI